MMEDGTVADGYSSPIDVDEGGGRDMAMSVGW